MQKTWILGLAVLLPGACKPHPNDGGADTKYASSETFLTRNLVWGLKSTGGNLTVCAEFRDKRPEQLTATDKTHREAAAREVQAVVTEWARASGLYTDPSVVAQVADYGGCRNGDLSNGRVAVHLLATEGGWRARCANDGMSPEALGYADNNSGIFVIPLHKGGVGTETFRFTALHEVGHMFGLADTYWYDPSTGTAGTTDTQEPSVMSGVSFQNLTPDDIAGVRAVAAAVQGNLALNHLCSVAPAGNYTQRTPIHARTIRLIYNQEQVLFCGLTSTPTMADPPPRTK